MEIIFHSPFSLIAKKGIVMKSKKVLLMGLFLSFGFSLFQPTSRTSKAINVEAANDEVVVDSKLASTYYQGVVANNLPTVIVDIETKEELEKVTTTEARPSNVILHFDENENIVDKEGNVIDSFVNVYAKLNKKILPIISLQDEKSMNAFIQFTKTKMDILDLSVMSSTPSIVKTIKEDNSKIRGIIEYNSLTGEEKMYESVVKPTNMNFANVAVLSPTIATRENVTYIQARFKTVWTRLESETDMDILSSIQTGTYGLIVKDYEHVYEIYTQFKEGSTFRPFFNVAHRGVPSKTHENSVSGTKKAIEVGATHVELDAYVTKDNKIYFMHDSAIARTSNGEGSIESYTSEELEKFDLDLFEPHEKIPSIDDIMQTLEGSSTIFILEIKTGKTNFPALLKEKLDEYNFYDQLVVISFSSTMLEKMKEELPMVPSAYLGSVNQSNFAKLLPELGKMNAAVDTSMGAFTSRFNEIYLRDRGLVGWYWTYENASAIENMGISNGVTGITNNVADYFTNVVYTLKGENMQLGKGQTISNETLIPLTATYYDGEEEEVIGQVYFYQEMEEGKYLALASYTDVFTNLTFYTAPFEIQDGEKEIVNPPKKSGCQKASTAVITSFSLLVFLGAILLKKSSYAN